MEFNFTDLKNRTKMKDKLIELINSKRKAKDIGYALIYCIDKQGQVEELADDIVKLFSIPNISKTK